MSAGRREARVAASTIAAAEGVGGNAWRYLFDLGLGEDASRQWIDDSITLASRPPGAHAREAAEQPLLLAVYRDLESIERARRAELLRAVARGLSRTVVATKGAAALDLLAPLAPDARERLRAGFEREARRGVSERLVRAGGSSVPLVEAFAPLRANTAPTPAAIVDALARLAQALEPGFEGTLVHAEVALAFAGGAAARPLLEPLRSAAADAPEPVVSFDRVERGRAAAAFAEGDDQTVLEILERGALLLDRSASAGAMRVAARYRSQGPSAAQRAGDEFHGVVAAGERRRIARFLVFAHTDPAGRGTGIAQGAPL